MTSYSYAVMDCRFKKVHPNCHTCKMNLFEVLGSIRVHSIIIDGEEKTASVYGEVDPNRVMRALGKSCEHAELVHANIRHPGRISQSNNYYYSQDHESSYGYSYDEDYYDMYNNPRTRQARYIIYPNGYGNDPPTQYIPHPVYYYTNPNDDNQESGSWCSIM